HVPCTIGTGRVATHSVNRPVAMRVGRLGSYTHFLLGSSGDEQATERSPDFGPRERDAGPNAQGYRPAAAESGREQPDEDDLPHPDAARREQGEQAQNVSQGERSRGGGERERAGEA